MNRILVASSVLLTLVAGARAADTSVSSQLNSGGLNINSDASVTIPAQTITATGVAASNAATFNVTITDLRGAAGTITVAASITQLDNSGNKREVSVEATSFSGDTTGVAGAGSPTVTSGGTATENSFITAPSALNRVFDATITVIGQALSLSDCHAGTYTGTITLTVS